MHKIWEELYKKSAAAVKLLTEKKMKIGIAESCTGGTLASLITAIPNSSAVFEFGAVVYANSKKEQFLGVRHETLEKYGAVSKQTAYEMAEGVLRASGSDIAVSITGLAGPGGETATKPIGLVYVGFTMNEQTETHELYNLDNSELIVKMGGNTARQRDYIRLFTVKFCLDLIISKLS